MAVKAIVALFLASITPPMAGATQIVPIRYNESGARKVAEEYLTVSDADRKHRMSQRVQEPSLPPPRDPEMGVREEYELARGSVDALALFIARHADHPLASAARRELEGLRREGLR